MKESSSLLSTALPPDDDDDAMVTRLERTRVRISIITVSVLAGWCVFRRWFLGEIVSSAKISSVVRQLTRATPATNRHHRRKGETFHAAPHDEQRAAAEKTSIAVVVFNAIVTSQSTCL